MPDGDKHNRLREVFDAALDAPPEQRRELLTRACSDDSDMLRRIEAMLIAAEGDDPFLREAPEGAGAACDVAATLDPSQPQTHRRRWLGEQPGTKIGPYKLLQLIGEGGFGSVYMAEQEQPVRRRVALKIIKLGMDTRQVIARFEAERQALAMMEHPNIAKVYDAGTTETGRPYFVMELVRGDPITHYCDTHNLNTAARLSLFQDVCRAVQHAHQKGIIHRDIKPSNVLVTVADGKPIPKVIDFGIAKATNVRLTEKTFFTEHRALIGTPEFMSPEQAEMSGVDIDTRSDVYSLGVLLYVLLTGTTPFTSESLRAAAFGEMQRIIRETDPPKPSTRLNTMGESLSSVASHRQSEPGKLAGLMRGDLDWIVMKAMEKDRTRRYDTASSLAEDIQRHLTGEAVNAAPPSASYKIRKFVRRNRAGVVAGSVIAAALVLGVIGTTIGMVWAINEKDRADIAATAAKKSAELESQAKTAAQASETRAINEAKRAESEANRARIAERDATARAVELAQVAEFQSTMLKDIDVALMGDRLREDILAEADAQFARLNLDQADAESRRAALRQAVADLNFTNAAIASLDRNILQRAIAAIDAQFADQPLVQARLLHTIADTLHSLGRLDSARPPLERALEIRRRLLGNTHLDTLDSLGNLATLVHDQGQDAAAEPLYREAFEAYRATLGEEHPQTLTAESNLAYWLELQGRVEEAEVMYRRVLDSRRRILGRDHEHTLISVVNLGVLLRMQDKLDEAEPLYREALDGYLKSLGEEHVWTLAAMNNMAFLLNARGKTDEAIAMHRETLRLRRRVLGDEHPHTLSSIRALAKLLRNQEKFAEAEALYREALKATTAAGGPDDPDTLLDTHNLATLLQNAGKIDEAESMLRDSLERSVRVLGADHADTIKSRVSLCTALIERAGVLIREGAPESAKRADTALVEAIGLREGIAAEDSAAIQPQIQSAIGELIALFDRLQSPDDAARWRSRLAQP